MPLGRGGFDMASLIESFYEIFTRSEVLKNQYVNMYILYVKQITIFCT